MAATVAPAPATTSLTPPASRDALNAECLGNVIAGRPLPEGLAPAPHDASRPSTAREGIERILGLAPGRLQ